MFQLSLKQAPNPQKNAGFQKPFDFKEGPANSQGVLNNSAKLTLKRRPLLNRAQH